MKRILIVDFDPCTSRGFSRVLSKQNFVVDSASDAQHAIEMMKKTAYDCILVSFNLPDIDGKDLLLFTRKSMPNAVKVIMTGFPSLGTTIKAIEYGVDAVFAKPVNPVELIRVIEEKIRQNQENEPNHAKLTRKRMA